MTSLICSCNGIGTIVAALASVYIVNPNNEMPTIVSQIGNVVYNYYDNEVADNLPKLFRYFVYIELVLLVFALLFVWIPDLNNNKDD